MKTLSKEQVLRLHNALLETFGGTAGVRDDGLLESALNAPFATFGGQYLYPSMLIMEILLVIIGIKWKT